MVASRPGHRPAISSHPNKQVYFNHFVHFAPLTSSETKQFFFRDFFQRSLKLMLTNDLRFCQMENVEQHMWKVAFHNVIEALRKAMADEPEAKEEYRQMLFTVIDDVSFYLNLFLVIYFYRVIVIHLFFFKGDDLFRIAFGDPARGAQIQFGDVSGTATLSIAIRTGTYRPGHRVVSKDPRLLGRSCPLS